MRPELKGIFSDKPSPPATESSKDFWGKVRARIAEKISKSPRRARFVPPQKSSPIAGLNAPIAPAEFKKALKQPEKNKRAKLMLRQEGKCAYCDRLFTNILVPTLDHVKPKSKGGKNGLANLVLACSPCNQLKGDLHTYEEAKRRADLYLSFADLLKEKGYIE